MDGRITGTHMGHAHRITALAYADDITMATKKSGAELNHNSQKESGTELKGIKCYGPNQAR